MMIMGWDDMQTHHSGPSEPVGKEVRVEAIDRPHPQFWQEYIKNLLLWKTLITIAPPPLEFVDIPTALNSESWPSFYQQTTQEVSGHNFYSFFTARTDFLPKYFLFLISGHFIIFSNKRRLDRICNIFWEIRRESQFSSVLLFSVRFLHINLS